ncbi:glycosyltransferase family 4 protein [Ralstonia solanacearum]|uniref:glycosyltransferase family 4 protein n=1 Tax=Ralstonia solanacearum TaxID=305 RepID=UPI00066226A8|nr:glycosyltransferase family 1 protein [Ralstonia solanacearum]
MKVVLSVEALMPTLTGIGRYTWELASRLPWSLGDDCVRYYRQGRWIPDCGPLLRSMDSLHARRRKLSPPRWLRAFGMKLACRGRIFHGPNYFLPPCADAGVATVHDLSVFKFPETHPVERVRHFEQEFRRSLARSAHLITDSEATRREVIDFLGWPADKITAVPLGVAPRFAPRADADVTTPLRKYGLTPGGYALCVSTLEPRKRIDHLIRAYGALSRPLRAQFPLVLAGSQGWQNARLLQEISRATGQGWLRYLGFVPEADLLQIYAGARLFVYPSIYEGFGLPVLEAMASGVPVVASNRASLPEVTKGAALLVDPDDMDALMQSVRTGLVCDAWRSSARSQGLRVAQDFSWDRCVEQTIRVYRRVTETL